MAVCETVTIKTENGDVDINKSDYDPKTHKLAGESTSSKTKKKAKG